MNVIYTQILQDIANKKPLLAVLIDPEKFELTHCENFIKTLPKKVTHFLIGGSTSEIKKTEQTITEVRKYTSLPILLFPGDVSQISLQADGLLFLSLLSGRNTEYLIEQQLKAIPKLKNSTLEIIPTAYILLDGGKESAVERVSKTKPISQTKIDLIANTALAGQYLGKKLIYLEAGSGALKRVEDSVITYVKKQLSIPLIVGGGIKSPKEMEAAFAAGADMVVIGTAFENNTFT